MYRFLLMSASVAVLLGMLMPVGTADSGLTALQEATPSPIVADILAGLSPSERVGQLFVVTFEGSSVDEGTPIFNLVTRYGVGGLILSVANDNFDDRENMKLATREMTEKLQQSSFDASMVAYEETSLATPQSLSTYLPLLIGVSQEGNGSPYSELLSGVTPLPSSMAVGATWSRDAARVVGQVTGYELSQLGINLLLGPNLDVLQRPQPANLGDPGVRSFGGDQYWVSELGKAYVSGVHSGSKGRMAVVAKTFPGTGAADRATDLDIPAISKSLDDLLVLDVAPFLAVTELDQDPLSVVDAVMPSLARYSSLQGSLSTTTRPLSLDGAALGRLMKLPTLAAWRSHGGVVLSAPLGRRGIRRFYDPTDATFPAFEIARDALLAGNDLLFVDEFGLDPTVDRISAVTEAIERFVQKYEEDSAFAERVDQAAQRVIGMKLRLYDGRPTIGNVVYSDGLESIGVRTTDIFDVAQEAVTLISPDHAVLAERLPRPPARYERIVVFTDSKSARQCSVCASVYQPEIDAFETAIVELYGYPGSGQISGFDIASFSFSELADYLAGDSPPPSPTPTATSEVLDKSTPAASIPVPTMGELIDSAKWLVFLLGDIDGEDVQGNALRRFLAERHDLIAERNIVVFAMGPPYLLDATEVSQLSAYYALYNRASPFVDVAARVLFQEIVPHNALPVSVPASSYDLDHQLSVDPGQVFKLMRDTGVEFKDEEVQMTMPAGTAGIIASATPLPITPIAAQVPEGTTVTMSTSTLLDRNGYLVPDGTVVEFEANYLSEGRLTRKFADPGTVNGVARATLVLDRTGLIEIRARSGEAVSETLLINASVSDGQPAIDVQTITPTATATATTTMSPTIKNTVTTATITPSPAPTHTLSPTLTLIPLTLPVAPTAIPPITASPSTPRPPPHISAWDLLSGALAMVVIGRAGWEWSRSYGRSATSGTRIVLLVTLGVWFAYNYYALQLPGADALRSLGALAPSLLAWGGGLAGLGLGWYWSRPR